MKSLVHLSNSNRMNNFASNGIAIISTLLSIIASRAEYGAELEKKQLNFTLVSELVKNLNTTKNDIIHEFMKVEMFNKNLETDSIDALNKTLDGLENNFPICHKNMVQILKENVLNLMRNEVVNKCSRIINSQTEKLDSWLNGIKYALDSTVFYQLKCEQMSDEICARHVPKYETHCHELEQITRNLSIWINSTTYQLTAKICLGDTISQMAESLSTLKLDENCGFMNTYRDFLDKVSLWPMSIRKLFALKNNSSVIQIQLPVMNETSSHKYKTPHHQPMMFSAFHDFAKIKTFIRNRLFRVITWLDADIEDYLHLVKFNITAITDNYVSMIQDLIRNLMSDDGQRVQLMQRDSYEALAQSVIDKVQASYKYNLSKHCFNGIGRGITTFHQIQNHLDDIKRIFHTANNSLYPVFYEKSANTVHSMEIFYTRWKEFDLSETWRFARTCYNVANSVVLGNIKKHMKMPYTQYSTNSIFQGLFPKLPIEEQEYPDNEIVYDTSEYNNHHYWNWES